MSFENDCQCDKVAGLVSTPTGAARNQPFPSFAISSGSQWIHKSDAGKKKAEELIDQARPTKLVAVLDGGSGPWQRRTARITKIE